LINQIIKFINLSTLPTIALKSREQQIKKLIIFQKEEKKEFQKTAKVASAKTPIKKLIEQTPI
jgi:hypothetical protein